MASGRHLGVRHLHKYWQSTSQNGRLGNVKHLFKCISQIFPVYLYLCVMLCSNIMHNAPDLSTHLFFFCFVFFLQTSTMLFLKTRQVKSKLTASSSSIFFYTAVLLLLTHCCGGNWHTNTMFKNHLIQVINVTLQQHTKSM